MQDRKITIAGASKTTTDPNTIQTNIQGFEHGYRETRVLQAGDTVLQNYMAHSHISHHNNKQYNYELNKPQQWKISATP